MFWKLVPWLNKVILLLSIAVYTAISVQPLVHPGLSAATQGLSIDTAVGITIFRVAFAGFPLGCAAFLVYSLLSAKRTFVGLVFAAMLLAVLLTVRVYGMLVDSSVPQSIALAVAEAVLGALLAIGAALDVASRRSMREVETNPGSDPRA